MLKEDEMLRRRDSNLKGSVLILMVIIIAVITSIGLVTLNIAVTQFQIKKSNSNIKRALYLSEDGINSSSLKAYNLICEACADSINKADEYITLYPDDIAGAENLFKNNYKMYVINKALQRINSNSNPSIEVTNYNYLFFINEKLTLRVKSKYIFDTGIEKSLSADLVILVPDYIDIKANTFDLAELFYLSNFDV